MSSGLQYHNSLRRKCKDRGIKPPRGASTEDLERLLGETGGRSSSSSSTGQVTVRRVNGGFF